MADLKQSPAEQAQWIVNSAIEDAYRRINQARDDALKTIELATSQKWQIPSMLGEGVVSAEVAELEVVENQGNAPVIGGGTSYLSLGGWTVNFQATGRSRRLEPGKYRVLIIVGKAPVDQ